MPVKDDRGVKRARDDAPTRREFRKLRRASRNLDSFSLQCRFLLVALGGLGLRAGELAHLQDSWVDHERLVLEIPSYEDCSCGYCRKSCEQLIERGYADDGVTMDDLMADRWNPKTPASVRNIPYGYDQGYVDVFDEFFDEYDGWPGSRASVNRRVDRIAEGAGIDKYSVYPHALRAYAAHEYARMGLRAHHLKKIMGWSNINAAVDYIELAVDDVEDALYSNNRTPPNRGLH
jgi:integrase